MTGGTSKDRQDKQLKPVLGSSAFSGTQLAVSVLLGFYAGHLLDVHFRTSPWFKLLGSALGIFSGLYNFLKPFIKNVFPRKPS
ncbi:MAG TPA: AtpZ/AtpI family protein [Elusimicrobiota bacterium]|nr:AtpZ/AtpI family protein [Elusimicrobiota bacterium]